MALRAVPAACDIFVHYLEFTDVIAIYCDSIEYIKRPHESELDMIHQDSDVFGDMHMCRFRHDVGS